MGENTQRLGIPSQVLPPQRRESAPSGVWESPLTREVFSNHDVVRALSDLVRQARDGVNVSSFIETANRLEDRWRLFRERAVRWRYAIAVQPGRSVFAFERTEEEGFLRIEAKMSQDPASRWLHLGDAKRWRFQVSEYSHPRFRSDCPFRLDIGLRPTMLRSELHLEAAIMTCSQQRGFHSRGVNVHVDPGATLFSEEGPTQDRIRQLFIQTAELPDPMGFLVVIYS